MNKLFILSIILAVCLVSVHAFAKRDTAAATDKAGDGIAKDLTKLSDDITKKLQETFDPEALKKFFNDSIDKLNQAGKDISGKFQQASAKQ